MQYRTKRTLFLTFFAVFPFFFQGCQSPEKNDDKKTTQQEDKEAKKEPEEKTILFFGNSLTAGQGVKRTEAFPALIRQKLDSLGWNFNVINAGLSGETTAGGASRIEWVMKGQEVDIFVLELGANDGLRGIDPSSSKKNLQQIIDLVKTKNQDTKIVLAGMKVPPNMGEAYGAKFEKIYSELEEENDLILIPFLLKGVAGEKELNQPDGIHPTAKGHRIVAQTVWPYLEQAIKEERAGKQN